MIARASISLGYRTVSCWSIKQRMHPEVIYHSTEANQTKVPVRDCGRRLVVRRICMLKPVLVGHANVFGWFGPSLGATTTNASETVLLFRGWDPVHEMVGRRLFCAVHDWPH